MLLYATNGRKSVILLVEKGEAFKLGAKEIGAGVEYWEREQHGGYRSELLAKAMMRLHPDPEKGQQVTAAALPGRSPFRARGKAWRAFQL